MTYRADIDILRAVAVVSVVLHHAGLALPGGFIGVDIFFVISGYLITGLLWNEARSGRISLMRFYERRIRRIFPALFVMIAVSSLFAAALFLPGHLAEFGVSAAAASVFLANVHFYSATGYFSEAAQLKPLLHTWSLAVEEQFYILFPPLLLLLLRIGSGRIVAGLLAGLAAISFALSLMAMRTDPAAAFYLPHMRAWQLLVGAALAIAMADLRLATLLARAARPLRGAGALLILGGLVFLSDADPYPGWRALTPCLGAALIIAAGPAATPKLLTPAVFVGRMSYSLYLWHWPVMVFVSYRLVDPLSVVEAWACVALSFIIAAASWRWVEQPFRTASWPAPLVYRTSGRAMAVVAALGAGLYFAKGLPQRLPGDLVRLAAGEGLLHDRRDCHFVTPERAASGDVCLRGDPSARPSFVLVGDSHADAVSPGLFSAASALGLRGAQYTQSGFLPLPGVAKQGAPGRDRAAAAFVDYLRERPELETVVLAGFWAHRATGRSYRHQGDVWMDAGYDGSGVRYNASALSGGLGRLISAFPDRRFVILDGVAADAALDPRTYARRAIAARAPETAEAGAPAAKAATLRATYEPVLRRVAVSYPNVSYAPVFRELCDAELCPLFDDAEPIYRNGDHLSVHGALKLAPALTVTLRDTVIASRD